MRNSFVMRTLYSGAIAVHKSFNNQTVRYDAMVESEQTHLIIGRHVLREAFH